MDQNVVDALELLHAGGGDGYARVAAAEVVKAWADAEQMTALYDVSQEQPAFEDPTGRPVDPGAAEVGAMMAWTTGAATERMGLAATLCEDLPEVLDALRRGLIDLARAREIVLGTCELDPDDRVDLARAALGYAGGHTRGQLRAWLARRVAGLHPDAAQRRRRTAVKRRGVWMHPESDGMATVSAYLTAEQARAVLDALGAAAANIEGGVDAARADVFVSLITGLTVGTPVPVTVVRVDTGPELLGYGPLSARHADLLCAGRPTITLNRPGPAGGYRPSPALARWVRAHHRHCRFPGCRRPAAQCDLDHVLPWPAGATSSWNLAPMCRRHHRLKTHSEWTVVLLPDGRMRWTSPRGRVYYTHLHDP